MGEGFSWNLVSDVDLMLSYPFMLNALRAGTIVAVVAGVAGYLMVLRRQSFAGHSLAVAGFPGASGATWLGVSSALGYYAFCIAGALVIAAISGTARAGQPSGVGQESAVIATVQAFALGCGLFFVSRYNGFLSGLTSLLFGSIIGVSDGQVLGLLVAGGVTLAGLAVLGRRLLFATVDSEVAAARGVPVRLIGTAWLVLLGVATAGASQVTGSLLVFALLVAPAATAIRLTARPGLGIALSVLIALAVTWVGETIAFFSPYPIGFWVSTLAFAGFALAVSYRAVADRRLRSEAPVLALAGA